MMEKSGKNLFILAGNGPYDNRGCEAIVRGTTAIIRKHFDTPEFLSISNFQQDSQFAAQVSNEIDSGITHKKTFRADKRYSGSWFLHTALRCVAPALRACLTYREMLSALKDAKAVLSVGGDNYSLDYGRPDLFTMLDDLVLSHKKPLIIWGASVGPFDKLPDYERHIIKHLKNVTGIFVRETVSLEYLASRGVKDNVLLVADPAFLLKPEQPAVVPYLEEGSVGLNLSPLMARYLTDGDYKKWVKLSADIVSAISRKTGRKIYLVPHVTSPHTNDYVFLKDVLSLLDQRNVELLGDQYSASELKWIISKMAVFAGARTHSTIAAISMAVPTLSFVYSAKAKGINRDVFGHENFCILKEDCHPVLVAQKIEECLAASSSIRQRLTTVIPEFQQKAMAAGRRLQEMC